MIMMTQEKGITQLNHDTHEHLLEVSDLHVEFRTAIGIAKAVNGVGFTLDEGKTLAVLGESGCGKSVTAQAILRIIDNPPGVITKGSIRYRGNELLELDDEAMRKVRGNHIAMIFQDAHAALNPGLTVGHQISEMLRVDRGISRQEANRRAIELMDRVQIPSARNRVNDYPHQFSGGMAQRVMIATALALDPDILIADEPTTALDVTVQAQVMQLLAELQSEIGMGLILITHDLGVVAGVADWVMVMYAGNVIETGSLREIYQHPYHPYTVGLMESVPQVNYKDNRLQPIIGTPPNPLHIPHGCAFHPRCPLANEKCKVEKPDLYPVTLSHHSACHLYLEVPVVKTRAMSISAEPLPRSEPREPLLRVEGLVKYFPVKSSVIKRHTDDIKAVDGINFEVYPGETLGLVGESGCGKSTVARTLLRLEQPTSGHAYFKEEDIFALNNRKMRQMRRKIQMIFQDPYTSLNPRMTVSQIISEPWEVHPGLVPRSGYRDRVQDLLRRVGLNPEDALRYPYQFSGGQRQRIGIAKALAFNPELIICDEPVSALDVSIQAQVVNLLQDIQQELGVAYIFIAHDLSVVRHISDRVAVMYLGKIVEIGTHEQIFENPTHPYTQALLSAVPAPNPDHSHKKWEIVLTGEVPSPLNPPSGCRFRTRCWKAEERCSHEIPELIDRFQQGHPSACHFADYAHRT